MAKTILRLIVAGVIVCLFVACGACAVLAWRTWSRSIVKVHRGPAAPQRTTAPLDPQDRDRIQTLIGCSALSGIAALGLLAATRGRER